GDAWFVGWNHDMTVAVWVGYPDRLVPMLTQFGGQPVAGGTYPALIWHDFMVQATSILEQRAAVAQAMRNGQSADSVTTTSPSLDSGPGTGTGTTTTGSGTTTPGGTGGSTTG